MGDYPLGLDNKEQPGGRVRFLEDADDDGRYDWSTLFLNGLLFPMGVIYYANGDFAPQRVRVSQAATDGNVHGQKVSQSLSEGHA